MLEPSFFPPQAASPGMRAHTRAVTHVCSALKLEFIYLTEHSPLLHAWSHYSVSLLVNCDHARNVPSYKRDVKPSSPLASTISQTG